MRMTVIDSLSLATVPVIPFFNDMALNPATSFVYRRRENFYRPAAGTLAGHTAQTSQRQ